MKPWTWLLLFALNLPILWVFAESNEPEPGLELTMRGEESNSLVISKDVTIPAEKSFKSIVIVNGNVDFYGQTEHLVVVSGSVKLRPGSKVSGELVVLNGHVEEMEGASAPNASVKFLGQWHSVKDKWVSRISNWLPSWDTFESYLTSLTKILFLPLAIAIPLAIFVVLTFFAMVFLLIAPQLSRLADDTFLRSPLASLGWGALGFLAFTPILVLMAISIVGIPIIPLFILFCLLLMLAGFFTVCRGVGHWGLSKFFRPGRFVSTLAGLIVLYALTFMPLLGKFVGMTALVLGTGALLRALLHRDHLDRPSYLDEDVYDIQ